MNDKKQIEEMAVMLTDGGCTECNCDADVKFNCLPMYEAELLYNAGYRKQNEGEWVKVMNHKECSKCGYNAPYKKIKTGYHLQDLTKYCPNCGAKMKGGAE